MSKNKIIYFQQTILTESNLQQTDEYKFQTFGKIIY